MNNQHPQVVMANVIIGLASGRYRNSDEISKIASGRFSPEYHNYQLYVERYWHAEIFSSLGLIRDAAVKAQCSVTSIAVRWILHHSRMIGGDAIVLGASTVEQLLEDLSYAEGDKLSDPIVALTGEVARIVKPIEAQYFRGYDPNHGSSNRFLDRYQ